MKTNEIYDVSAELEREFGAKGTPQREAAINHAWEEYNAQILMDARKNAGLTQAELAERIGYCRYTIQDSSSNGNDGRIAPSVRHKIHN